MSGRIPELLELRRQRELELQAATAELHEAIRAEVAGGASVASVAEAAGMSRQGVYGIVRDGVAPLEQRRRDEAWLADFDRRYDALVEAMWRANYDPAEFRAITAGRNVKRAKLERKLGGDVAAARREVPTVTDDGRRWAEAQLMRLLEDRVDDPTVREIGRQLDKAESLRSKLYAAQLDAISGHD